MGAQGALWNGSVEFLRSGNAGAPAEFAKAPYGCVFRIFIETGWKRSRKNFAQRMGPNEEIESANGEVRFFFIAGECAANFRDDCGVLREFDIADGHGFAKPTADANDAIVMEEESPFVIHVGREKNCAWGEHAIDAVGELGWNFGFRG